MRRRPPSIASLGIGGVARPRSRIAVTLIVAVCVRALTERQRVPSSPPNMAVKIPNVVAVHQVPRGLLHVPRLAAFDLMSGCAFGQPICRFLAAILLSFS